MSYYCVLISYVFLLNCVVYAGTFVFCCGNAVFSVRLA